MGSRRTNLKQEVDSFDFPEFVPKFRKLLLVTIFKYILTFVSSSPELRSTDLIKHSIDTQRRGSIILHPYRSNVMHRDIVLNIRAGSG